MLRVEIPVIIIIIIIISCTLQSGVDNCDLYNACLFARITVYC